MDSWSTGIGTLKNIGSLKACNVICKQREKIGQYILYTSRKKLRQGLSLSGILPFIGVYVEFNVYICIVFSNREQCSIFAVTKFATVLLWILSRPNIIAIVFDD